MTEDDYISLIDIPDYLNEYNFMGISAETSGSEFHHIGNQGLTAMVEDYEKALLVDTLKKVSSISEASRVLKMTRQAVKYKIEKYGIEYKELLK